MFDIIDWKLPKGAFYGTAQGKNLNAVLDNLSPEERQSVWHVTEPDEHLLFRREADARAYLTERLGDVQSRLGVQPEPGCLRYEAGEHWKWSRTDELGFLIVGHITLWRHTAGAEAARAARQDAEFARAADAARRLFARSGQREFIGAAHWSEFLTAPARRYGQRRGII